MQENSVFILQSFSISNINVETFCFCYVLTYGNHKPQYYLTLQNLNVNQTKLNKYNQMLTYYHIYIYIMLLKSTQHKWRNKYYNNTNQFQRTRCYKLHHEPKLL